MSTADGQPTDGGHGILEETIRHDYGPNLRYVVAMVARSDASEWEKIVDYDKETGALVQPGGSLSADHRLRQVGDPV